MNIQLDRGAGFISIFWETWQGSRQKRKEIPPKGPEPQPRFLGRCRRCSVLSHTWSAIGRTFKEDYTCHECVLPVQALFMAFLCFKTGGFLIERKNEKVKQSARSCNDLRNGKSPCHFCSGRRGVCTEDVRQHLVTGSTGGCDCAGTDHKRSVQFIICRNFSRWNVLVRIFL